MNCASFSLTVFFQRKKNTQAWWTGKVASRKCFFCCCYWLCCLYSIVISSGNEVDFGRRVGASVEWKTLYFWQTGFIYLKNSDFYRAFVWWCSVWPMALFSLVTSIGKNIKLWGHMSAPALVPMKLVHPNKSKKTGKRRKTSRMLF